MVTMARPAPSHRSAARSGGARSGGARSGGVRSGGGRSSGVRLTRRGRMVVLTLLLLLTGAVAMLAAPDGDAAAPPGTAPSVVVRPGDTLWSLATRYVPDRDPFGGVEEIRRLNDLDGYTIQVGQTLVLPARG